MPQPTSTLVTLRPELRTFEQFDLAMDRAGFIGMKIMPAMDVPASFGNFNRIKLESLLRVPDTLRGPRGEYNEDDFSFDPLTYTTKEYGYKGRVDDNESKMYADIFDYEQIVSNRVSDALLRAQEVRIAAATFNSTTFTAQNTNVTAAAGYKWSNVDSSKPITDVEVGARAIRARIGRWPNAFIIGALTFRDLCLNAQVTDAVRSSGAGSSGLAQDIGIDQLKKAFRINQIIVADCVTNTANPGQTRSLSELWDPTMAMLAVLAETNDIAEVCLGRTFHWPGDGSNLLGTPEQYRWEDTRANYIRTRHQVGEKQIYPEAAQLFTNVS